MDHGAWSDDLPPEELVELGHRVFYIIHDLHRLDLAPEAAGIDVVVHGHTHRPDNMRKDGVLYLNPGSASYPRAGTPSGVYLVEACGNGLDIRHIALDDLENG
jgi:putative phosphoesterase